MYRAISTGSAFPALLLCGLALLPSAAIASDVTGTVTDTSGTPISGAIVRAGSLYAYTGSAGQYHLTGVPPGAQSLLSGAFLYKTSSLAVTAPASGTLAGANLSLPYYAGNVTGVVSNSATGQPMQGATVAFAGRAISSVTDQNGVYTLSQVRAGSQTLNVTSPGYPSFSVAVKIPVGGTLSQAIAVQGGLAASAMIPWNGSAKYLLGVDMPWSNYGTDFGTGGWGKFTNWNSVNTSVAGLAASGAHVVRWWLFADGRYSPEFNADGTVSGLDSSVLPDIDSALQTAAQNNVYILFTVIDNSMWGPSHALGSGVVGGGHSALVTSSTVQQSYLDNALKPVLQHIAASPNRSRVLGFDLVNEPEGQMSGYWGGVNLAPAQVQAFVQKCAAYVHTYGAGAYATVGAATPYYTSTWTGLGLDFYETHYYPWMDFGNGAGAGLPTFASLGLDHPCVIGEFPSIDASYGQADTAPLSAAWYLNTIRGQGYAGAFAWSLTAGDSATNWAALQPVYSGWAQANSSILGP